MIGKLIAARNGLLPNGKEIFTFLFINAMRAPQMISYGWLHIVFVPVVDRDLTGGRPVKDDPQQAIHDEAKQ